MTYLIIWLIFGLLAWVVDSAWELGFGWVGLIVFIGLLAFGPIGFWYSVKLWIDRRGFETWMK